MARKSGLRLHPELFIASAGLAILATTSVPRDVKWCLQSIAWEINLATSGGNTRCRLYVDRGAGEKHFLDEQLTPVADWLYTRSENDYLYPGERLVLEIDEAQASTTAKMDVSGYREVEE